MNESFRDLIAWQKAMTFITDVYLITESFPAQEQYGLTNQIRRASVSVASNIAEGKGRLSRKEFVHFLAVARGSLFEAQTQLEVGLLLGYLTQPLFSRLEQQACEVGRIINGLIAHMSRLPGRGRTDPDI